VVGPLVWARAAIEPGNVPPNSTSNIIDLALISRDDAALNRSPPNVPSVFPQWPYVDAALLERYKVAQFRLQPIG
jgi:hypothetical protein